MVPDNIDLFLSTLWLALGDTAVLLWKPLWMGAVFVCSYRLYDDLLSKWLSTKSKKNDKS